MMRLPAHSRGATVKTLLGPDQEKEEEEDADNAPAKEQAFVRPKAVMTLDELKLAASAKRAEKKKKKFTIFTFFPLCCLYTPPPTKRERRARIEQFKKQASHR